MKSILFVLLLSLCAITIIVAQTAAPTGTPVVTPTAVPTCGYCTVTVSGKVSDQGGNSIPDARITLLTTFKTTTDSQGMYSFTMQAMMSGTGCPVGDTYIFVEKEGYVQAERFISVSGCAAQTHNFTLTPVSQTTPDPTVNPKGDVNGSGSADIVDALLVAQYYIGLTPVPFDPVAADANCDGSIDIIDALRIAQYYIGLISVLC